MNVCKSLSVLVLGFTCMLAAGGCNKPADSGSTGTAPAPNGGAAVEEVQGAASGSSAAPVE